MPVSVSPITIERLPVLMPHALSARSSAPGVPFAGGPISSLLFWVGMLCPVLLSAHCSGNEGSFGVALAVIR